MTISLTELKTLTQYEGVEAELQLYSTQGQATADAFLADTTLTDAVKDVIALYLAGHFYVISVEFGGTSFMKSGESEERYRTPASDKVGFQATRFGQQACALDTSGTLIGASMPTSVRSEFSVMNTST